MRDVAKEFFVHSFRFWNDEGEHWDEGRRAEGGSDWTYRTPYTLLAPLDKCLFFQLFALLCWSDIRGNSVNMIYSLNELLTHFEIASVRNHEYVASEWIKNLCESTRHIRITLIDCSVLLKSYVPAQSNTRRIKSQMLWKKHLQWNIISDFLLKVLLQVGHWNCFTILCTTRWDLSWFG